MPPSYQRCIITGVPCWKDADDNLYYYESSTQPTEQSRILIGSVAVGFNPDWQVKLEPILTAYRTSQKSRARVAPAKN